VPVAERIIEEEAAKRGSNATLGHGDDVDNGRGYTGIGEEGTDGDGGGSGAASAGGAGGRGAVRGMAGLEASFADGDMFGAGNADFLAMKATDKSGKMKASGSGGGGGSSGGIRRSAAEEGSASSGGGGPHDGEASKPYESMLAQSESPPHSDSVSMELRRMNCIYKSGLDRAGAVVIVCNVAPLVAVRASHHHVLLHLVAMLDPIVHLKFSIVYLHSELPSEYRPSYGWLKEVHSLLLRRYKKNIQHLFVFNSTIWLRTAISYAVPPTSKLWQQKLHFLERLEEIHTCIEPNQIMIDPGLVKPLQGASGLLNFFKKITSS